jgi:two-component sensor histidine kinase
MSFEIKDGKIILGRAIDSHIDTADLKGLPARPILNFAKNVTISSLGLRSIHEIMKKFDYDVFFEDCTDSILNAMNLSEIFIPKGGEDSIISILVPWISGEGHLVKKSLHPRDCKRLLSGDKVIYSGKPESTKWLKFATEFLMKPAQSDAKDLQLQALFHDIKANLRHSEALSNLMSEETSVLFRRLLNRTRSMISGLESEQKFGPTTSIVDLDLFSQEFSAIYKTSGKSLEYAGRPSFKIDCEAIKLERALSCLLYNALSASKAMVKMSCHIKNKRDLEILIEDDGPGLPEGFKAFDPGQTFGKVDGSGIGLYSVKEFVTSLKGTIEYRRDFGKTTFEIKIPALVSSSLRPQVAVVSSDAEVINSYKTLSQGISADFSFVSPSHFHNGFPFDVLVTNDRRSQKIAKSLNKPVIFANLGEGGQLVKDVVEKLLGDMNLN